MGMERGDVLSRAKRSLDAKPDRRKFRAAFGLDFLPDTVVNGSRSLAKPKAETSA